MAHEKAKMNECGEILLGGNGKIKKAGYEESGKSGYSHSSI
jgi:hypothetical protein